MASPVFRRMLPATRREATRMITSITVVGARFVPALWALQELGRL